MVRNHNFAFIAPETMGAYRHPGMLASDEAWNVTFPEDESLFELRLVEKH